MPDQGQPSIGHLLRCPLFSLVSCAGHIRYSNPEAKKSFLDSLSVPIGLVRGIVGTLEAQAREQRAKVLVAGRAENYTGHDVLDDLSERLPEVEIKIR